MDATKEIGKVFADEQANLIVRENDQQWPKNY
jgi:hypothetical protein